MGVPGFGAPVTDRHPATGGLAIAGVKAELAHGLPGGLGPLLVAQVPVRAALGGQRQVPAHAPRDLAPIKRAWRLHGRLQVLQFGLRRAQTRH